MTLLIGAGGHAKVVAEIFASRGTPILRYADPTKAAWLDAEHIPSDEEAMAAAPGTAALGLGGISPDSLTQRLGVMRNYQQAGWNFEAVIHPSAIVSPSAEISAGALVLAGAIIQPDAKIGDGAIINTGAIVEHDSDIGAGAHVAPGAIILGEVTVGDCAMIGAGSLTLPGSDVAPRTLVSALERKKPT